MSVENENEFDSLLYDVDEPLDEYGEPMDEPGAEEENNEPKDTSIESPEALEEDEETQEPEPEPDSESEQEPEPESDEDEKPEQTPEDNAKFAEMRRQKQIEERVQKELEKRMADSPEMRIAKALSEQYGMPPDQIYEKMQESMLQKQAEEQNVPIEWLREQQRDREKAKELESKLNQLEFDNWYKTKQSEGQAIKDKYQGVINDNDINDTIFYMLNELGTTNMSLDKAVRLVHGDKIETELRKLAKQEALAEISGRKQSPLAPQGVKSSSQNQLSAEESYVAKQMGLTEEEYLKYK